LNSSVLDYRYKAIEQLQANESESQHAAQHSVNLSLFLIGRRNRRARREAVQGAAGRAGHDVRVADEEGEVGVNHPSLRAAALVLWRRSNPLATGDCFVAHRPGGSVPGTNAPRNDGKENTLSDMDTEVTALEGKLSKARQVTQGMMSILLTGRVRLVTV